MDFGHFDTNWDSKEKSVMADVAISLKESGPYLQGRSMTKNEQRNQTNSLGPNSNKNMAMQMHQRRKGASTSHGGQNQRPGFRQNMARSKSPSTAKADGIQLAKEAFKITGNNRTFMNQRKSLNENKQMFNQSLNGGDASSEVNFSMPMKKDYQNWQGRFEVFDQRKNSQ